VTNVMWKRKKEISNDSDNVSIQGEYILVYAKTGQGALRLEPLQMIWLGGGYPELYAADLAANTAMLKHLRAAHQRGVAIYAECG
ncbi:hypothetical protein MJL27_27155, partial [Salmonella enterica subsp. enterica serovar Anatum]|nr:hypothetical protein [Salmonella enterica subsp. enterica serovar Anatum]